MEERITEIDDTMCLPEYSSDVGRLTELSKEKEALSHELELALEEWEKYAEELEQLPV